MPHMTESHLISSYRGLMIHLANDFILLKNTSSDKSFRNLLQIIASNEAFKKLLGTLCNLP